MFKMAVKSFFFKRMSCIRKFCCLFCHM